jgi:hypothetical protein
MIFLLSARRALLCENRMALLLMVEKQSDAV